MRAAEPLPGIEKEINDGNLKPDAPWGLVVYRTCYNDEAGWQRVRGYLEALVRESLKERSRDSMLERHRFVFMDDEACFGGASAAEIRDNFEHWAREQLDQNWAAQPVTEAMRLEMYGPRNQPRQGQMFYAGTRYNVCAVIDDVCLQSFDEKWPGLHGLIMLVRREWDPSLEEGDAAEAGGGGDSVHPDYDDGWMVDLSEGPNGWIYVPACEYVDLYDTLSDGDEWQQDHRFMYPSLVYGAMGLERSPGFWRRAVPRRGPRPTSHFSKESGQG